MALNKSVSLALLIFTLSCGLCWCAQTYVSRSLGGDMLWSLSAAQDLIHGRDPYGYATGPHWTPYPLPAALIAIPFSFLPVSVGAAMFFGVSAGLLAFGLTRENVNRLLIFLAMPFWFALVWAQWSPLVMAAAFIPVLLPVILIKPQIALPVGITRWSKTGLYACTIVLILSLVIYPTWPIVWLSQIKSYQRFFPFLSVPFGPFLLLAALRWRDPDARLFLLISLFPQRHFYDAFVLWLIPKNWKEIVPTAIISWGAWIWKSQHQQMQTPEVGLVSVVFFFLPMLCVILFRPTTSRPEIATTHRRCPRGK